MRKTFVILNPVSDRGQAGKREGEVREALDRAGIRYDLVLTRRPGHATELARKAVEEGVTVVVAAGGDGTVNEVAQALVNTEVPLGVLPIGSGNDYARVLGIPKDLGAAAQRIAQGNTRRVDVGRTGERFFLNSLGMGIDGQIALDYHCLLYTSPSPRD